MYVSPWLQSILIPSEWDVCGASCKPLTLWHTYILRTSGNPYLCGGKPTPDAAVEVIMYCIGDIDHGRKLYNNERYRKKCRKLVTRATKRKMKKYGNGRLHDAVSEYVLESLRVPTHSMPQKSEKKGKPLAAPESFVLAEYLLQLGVCCSFDDAMDYPYALAICIFDAGRNYRGEDENAPLVTEKREQELDEIEDKKAVA